MSLRAPNFFSAAGVSAEPECGAVRLSDMDAVEEFLADHDGIISMRQARELGLSQRQVAYRAKKQRWQRLSRGIYLSGQHHLTDVARVRVAVETHGAVADRTAAAFWHGLIPELPLEVTVSSPRTVHGKAISPSRSRSNAEPSPPRTSRNSAEYR